MTRPHGWVIVRMGYAPVMSMTVTIVVTIQDGKFAKNKHATATAGQESSLHVAGEAAVEAVRHALGGSAVNSNDVALTSITVS